MQYILQTNQLTKRIDEKELVVDVDLHIRKGEITVSLAQTERVKLP